MSAIYGIFRKTGQPVTKDSLAPIDAALKKWGPDGQGMWMDGNVGLGQRMLHITPESLEERLPAQHPENPNLIITADARLDNRRELSDLLGIPASQAKDIPDSQLILHAYYKWGLACTDKLLGAFAFAIWDGERRQLFCGRDHMGFRPFYYYNSTDIFVFASDIRALLNNSLVPQRLDPVMLAACLQIQTQYAEKTRTYFEDICKLPPAFYLTVSKDNFQLSKYWSLENAPPVRLASNSEYAENLRELLEQALECRIRSAFPVGSHLSGGLDSSTLAVMAARSLRQSGQQLSAYSWSPPPGEEAIERDERQDILALCELEDIHCHFIEYTEDNIIRILRRDFTTEPVEMLQREQLVQNQAVQNGVRVMLSGWGGDEAVTFNGRGYHAELFQRGRWLLLHKLLFQRAQEVEGSWLRRVRGYGGVAYRGVLQPMLPDFVWGWQDPYSVNLPAPITCINPHFADRYRQQVNALRGPAAHTSADIHQQQRRLLENGHLTRRIEDWAISGAEKKIEYRYPLLDRRLLEFIVGVPTHLYLQDRIHRALFRYAVQGILPPNLQWKLPKSEPAAIGQVLQIFPNAVNQYYQQVRGTTPVEILTDYLDLEHLDRMVPALADNLRGSGVIINAASLFSVKALIKSA